MGAGRDRPVHVREETSCSWRTDGEAPLLPWIHPSHEAKAQDAQGGAPNPSRHRAP